MAAALTSYLLGDSVLQFSTIIGTYLFAMGIGSYASGWIHRGLLISFIRIQYAVGLVGGSSAFLLQLVFGYGSGYHFVLYSLVTVIGALVGMEIPLLLRLLKERFSFRDLVSQVLALDYIGALAASLLFPLFLLPTIGLMRTSFLFGMINVATAFAFSLAFDEEQRWRGLQVEGAVLLLLLAGGFVSADRLTTFTEEALFPDQIILAETTPYQRIVVTQDRGDIRLHLNNNLQFSSRDEYRYHEALVVPALRSVRSPKRVLVLGGGDGLAVSLLLKDPRVEEITLVELDPVMTELFSEHPVLSGLNGGALRSPKVRIVHEDAFVWLDESSETFDLAIVDFPDPGNYSVGKLYTKLFYLQLKARLREGGLVSVQCSSPMFARRTFWCITETLKSAGFQVRPYHAFVPSFGEWGYCLAGEALPESWLPSPFETRFLDDSTLESLFNFPPDMGPVEVKANEIFDQQIVRYFRLDWGGL